MYCLFLKMKKQKKNYYMQFLISVYTNFSIVLKIGINQSGGIFMFLLILLNKIFKKIKN